jgi:hypothetical protein
LFSVQKLSVAELEAVLLKAIRKVHGCETIQQVTIIPRGHGEWIIGPIRLGQTDQLQARHAIARTESRFRDQYCLDEDRRS